MKEKMLKLYKDWEQSQDLSVVRKARKALDESINNPSNFNKVIKMMGMDGRTFTQYFEESKYEFSENSFKAKRKASAYLLEKKEEVPVTELSVDNFRLAYEPIDKRGNTMTSYIEAGTANGSPTEIIRAIVGGNMQIAAAMTMASWGKLSIGDRNAILNIANVHGGYNQGNGVSKDSGNTKFYTVDVEEGPIKKKGDMSKDEFLATAFPFADPQNTKLYKGE